MLWVFFLNSSEHSDPEPGFMAGSSSKANSIQTLLPTQCSRFELPGLKWFFSIHVITF
jgi:hypothetical protein